MTLDIADIRILDALQRDGRLGNAELADHVGLSPSQCSRRRMALEQTGLIDSYAAHLSADKLGLGVTVFVYVSLHAHSEDAARRFATLVNTLPEVQEAYSVTGDVDYHLKLVVPDLAALSHILNERLLAHDTVARLRSSVALERLKETSALPLSHLS